MSGDLRGERQFITEADFKYPLKVSKPQEVNLKRKYKIIGNNDIGFYFAVILFVAGMVQRFFIPFIFSKLFL